MPQRSRVRFQRPLCYPERSKIPSCLHPPSLKKAMASPLSDKRLIEMEAEAARLREELADAKSKLEHYQTAFELSPVAVLITRMTDQILVEVNRGFCLITGYS